VSFASAMAVVTLNIHYRGLRGAEVPTKVKTIFLRFLARIVFVQYAAPAKKERRAEKNFHVSLFCYLLI
jgi:nicotinic acetylcholine receptor